MKGSAEAVLAHLDLFSGIGGVSLAAEAAGFPTVAFCERDAFCRRALAHHWPGVPCYDDIHAITADRLRADGIGPIGIVSGGPPCQPASVAGRRGGVDDARWLWPEYLRVVAEVRPRWAVAENPTGIFSLDAGRPFGGILAALDALGYVGWWGVWGAGDVGAPHRRERVFVVGHLADAEGTRSSQRFGRGATARPGPECCGQGVADATPQLLDRAERTRRGRPGLADAGSGTAQPGLGGVVARIPARLDGHPGWPARPGEAQHAWEPPRTVAGRVPDRVARLRSLGNAVMPAQAYPIFAAIAAYEQETA